jgi:hypothetical protein
MLLLLTPQPEFPTKENGHMDFLLIRQIFQKKNKNLENCKASVSTDVQSARSSVKN